MLIVSKVDVLTGANSAELAVEDCGGRGAGAMYDKSLLLFRCLKIIGFTFLSTPGFLLTSP